MSAKDLGTQKKLKLPLKHSKFLKMKLINSKRMLKNTLEDKRRRTIEQNEAEGFYLHN